MSTTEAAPTGTDGGFDPQWHLRDNWGPVDDEVTATELEVEGEIPAELDGHYMRNGFNPKDKASAHWFFGHGMVHAFDLRDGTASYRNRYVHTPFNDSGSSEMKPELMMDLTNSPANTNVVRHAGRIWTLEEAHHPWEIDHDLDTIGVDDFGGKVVSAFTAHPKLCPVTGEMLAFGYSVAAPPHLHYYRFSPDGELVQVEPITLPAGVMMHDFNITDSKVVWMDLPACFSMERAMAGESPFFWNPDNGARLGVMPRDGGDADVQWFDIEPGYVVHPFNSYDDGDRIVLDVSRLDTFMNGGFDDISEKGKFWRWTIDLASGSVAEEQMDDRLVDFGRVNDLYVGQKTPYAYGTQLLPNPYCPEIGSQIYKYDLATGEPEIHDMGDLVGGEAVFVGRGPDADHDDGWGMVLAYDPDNDRSELRIINGQDWSGEPAARIFTPQRVPYGAHGNWMPRL